MDDYLLGCYTSTVDNSAPSECLFSTLFRFQDTFISDPNPKSRNVVSLDTTTTIKRTFLEIGVNIRKTEVL
jgi:hypothetical protein